MRELRFFVLAAAVGLAGCDNKQANTGPGMRTDATTAGTPAAKGKGAGKKDHEHGAGPHGGAIGEFGGKYHFEFTVNHKTQEATVYILGGDAQTAAPIK